MALLAEEHEQLNFSVLSTSISMIDTIANESVQRLSPLSRHKAFLNKDTSAELTILMAPPVVSGLALPRSSLVWSW